MRDSARVGLTAGPDFVLTVTLLFVVVFEMLSSGARYLAYVNLKKCREKVVKHVNVVKEFGKRAFVTGGSWSFVSGRWFSAGRRLFPRFARVTFAQLVSLCFASRSSFV